MGFRSIVFDCDSTLVSIEGIDELAGERIEEIRQMTDLAMAGVIPLEDVYGKRLEIIRPTAADVAALGARYVATLVPDARETVAALLALGKEVRVISGGLLPAVVEVAEALGIGRASVAAVDVRFDDRGQYVDFDRGSPMARSGGKPEQIRSWALPGPVLMVGDGSTDLEAREAVDAFAAYMGVAWRESVAAGADFVLRDPSLAAVLAIACSEEERSELQRRS